MDTSPSQSRPISREEISTLSLSRERRARLLVRRILERLQPSSQTEPDQPDDALTHQLASIRRRAVNPSPTIGARDLLSSAEQWLELLPDDPPLRAELLRQLQQRISFNQLELVELKQLFCTDSKNKRRGITWRGPVTWPVGVKLGSVMVLCSLVPSLLVGNLGAWMAEKQAEQALKEQLQGFAATVAGRLDENLSEYGKLTQYLARDPAVVQMAAASLAKRPLLESEVLGLLDRLHASHPNAAFIYLIDRDGLCFASSDRKLIGHNYSFRTYVQQGLLRDAYMSGIYLPISTTNPRATVSITRPIRLGAEVVGVAAVGSYALADSKALDLPKGLTGLVLEKDGVIASSNNSKLSLGIAGPEDLEVEDRRRKISLNAGIDEGQRFRRLLGYHRLSPTLEPMLTSSQEGVATGRLNNQAVVAAWRPLEAYGAKAVVMQSQQVHLHAVKAVHNRVMLITSLLGLVATGVAVGASQRISRPLRSLTQAAAQMETDQPLEEEQLSAVIRRQDDLGVLARQLLQAARESLRRQATLRAQVAALHIKVDQKQRDRDVAVIVNSDYFGELTAAAEQLRTHRRLRRKQAATRHEASPPNNATTYSEEQNP